MHKDFLRDRPDMKNLIKRRTYQDQEAERSRLYDACMCIGSTCGDVESKLRCERKHQRGSSTSSAFSRDEEVSRSCEDFESDQVENETKTLPALLEMMDMDFDWNNTVQEHHSKEKRPRNCLIFEGMDFGDTRKRRVSSRPSEFNVIAKSVLG